MWPDFPIANPRVFGKFLRWVNKADERVRIVWGDGEPGTHSLDDLVEHGLSFEDREMANRRSSCSSRSQRRARARRGGPPHRTRAHPLLLSRTPRTKFVRLSRLRAPRRARPGASSQRESGRP